MSSDKKLGRAVNMFCSLAGIIASFVLTFTEGTLPIRYVYGIRIYTVLVLALLLVAVFKKDRRPRMVNISATLIYISLIIELAIVSGNNNLLFVLMLLGTGTVSLLFDKLTLQIFMTICPILAMLFWLFKPTFVENVYTLPEYLIGVFCLIVGDIILYNIQRLLLDREVALAEEHETTDEILKIIDAKREEALYATKSKSEFLASMSHEIRTPINAVLGLNEMILRESKEKNTLDYAQDIGSAGNSLLSLVNDILDFSKIEAGKMEIQPVVYDMGSMLNDLINMITVRAMNKGLSFRMDIDPSLPHALYGDEVRIKQCITNILTNAVKYTNEGYVNLIISYEKVDEFQIDITVSVVDTGIGMKKEDIDKLFKPFERIEEVRNRHVEGTGLGMTLTRNILSKMGSDIKVESEYEKGTCMSFTIRQEVENWECIGSLDEAIKRIRNDRNEEEQYVVAPDAHILVVDDMPLNIKVFTSLLKRSQAQIDEALSGREALSLVRKNKYDIIFMDHMMPEMDGIETLKKMQGDRFNINRYVTPVIALTANAVSGAREMYIEAGFENYLTKPIDSGKLESMLVKYLDPSRVRMSSGSEAETFQAAEQTSDTLDTRLRGVEGLDVEAGISSSGGLQIYENVVHEYCITIDTYADLIEKYWKEGDIRDYTIQVHALKSSSRLLGALELSELAKKMEDCGNHEDYDSINEYTPKLLEMYRSLKKPLSQALDPGAVEQNSAPMIDEAMLKDALMAMKEGIGCFDFDLIESVMNELAGYSMPENFAPVYEKLKVYMAQVAMEDMDRDITEYLEKQKEA